MGVVSKSTTPITYVYDVDGHTVAVTRRHVGTAYARNGNVGNPSEHFVWDGRVDDNARPAVISSPTRADAYEHARASALGIPYSNDDTRRRYVNVRVWTVVQKEMRANYRHRSFLHPPNPGES